MYTLTAFDSNNHVIIQDTGLDMYAAFIGFDIWCDGSLDKYHRIDHITLVDETTGEVILSGKVK